MGEDHSINIIFSRGQNKHDHLAHSESLPLSVVLCSLLSVSLHGPRSRGVQYSEVIVPASVREAKLFLSKQAARTDYRRVPFLEAEEEKKKN